MKMVWPSYLQELMTRRRASLHLCVTAVGLALLLCGHGAAQIDAQDLSQLNYFIQTSSLADEAINIFRQGRVQIEAENWNQASERFDAFVKNYPQHKDVDAALYWSAFALKKQGKPSEAEKKLERLIGEFPQSNWLDDAKAMQLELASALGNLRLVSETLKQSTTAIKDPNSEQSQQSAARTSDDSELKLVALQSLFQANPERGIAVVAEMLKPNSNASSQLKESALALLGRSPSPQATTLLMDIARRDPETKLRKTAISWLGARSDEKVWDLLKDLATASNDTEIAVSAVAAISRQPQARATAILGELARSATSSEVRRQAIFGLGQRSDGEALDALMKLFEAEPDVEKRKQIISAVSRLQGSRARAELLKIARFSPQRELRQWAILGLGRREDEAAASSLIEIYNTEQNEEIKIQIILALGGSKSKAGLQKLIELAKKETSIELRRQAILALGRSSDPEAIKFLEGILK